MIKNYISNNKFKYYVTNYNLVTFNEELNLKSNVSNTNYSIILYILNKLNLSHLSWTLKLTIFTLFRKIEISIYFILLIILLVLNTKKFKIKYLNYFIILELLLCTV
jgi:hypothetical protein